MTKLADVSSPYGAPMGRTECHNPQASAPKFTLQRVRINAGGYDSGGAYWGVGQPLYWYESDEDRISGFLRAADRTAAKAVIRKTYPDARFLR